MHEINLNFKLCPVCKNERLLSEFYKYSSSCKSCYLQNKKQWRLNNKDKIKLQRRQYRINTREKCKRYEKNYKMRHPEKISIKIRRNLRRRIRDVLSGKNKCEKTMTLIGCNVSELRFYLEKKFQPGMNWNNYGFGNDKWHIDHIIPCYKFNLLDVEQQKKCFHFSNMQPLWQLDHIEKHRKQ